jgi:hypothetical protein
VSNGEFVPAPPTQHDVALTRLIREEVDKSSRRAGIDRRRFLEGAGGVAATLAAFNLAACSGSRRTVPTTSSLPPSTTRPAPSATSSSTSSSTSVAPTEPGGTFEVPTSDDQAACQAALGGNGEFIFDVHTHHVMPNGPWRSDAPDTVRLVMNMLPRPCSYADPFECANRAAYLHDLFLASDTTVALLSDVPNSGPADAPVPFPDAVGTQQLAATLTHGGAPRVLVHNVIAPNVGDLQARLDGMTATVATGHVAAFKVYTAWSPNGRGFALDDPAIGLPVLQHAHDLGVRVFCAHKGLPLVHFDPAHNRPDDMVAVSRIFPDMQFVVFHGAWDPHHREGPYNPASTLGIDLLLAALDRHAVSPNSNVWVDLGTVWRQVLTDPTQAAHVLGKLLTRVGQDRVLWGTDAIWYGGPQAQIMALRAFQISAAFQERYGYPALTDDLKRKIFGLNAATLFGLDAEATRCGLATDPLSLAQPDAFVMRDEGALPSPNVPNGPTTRREVLQWLSGPGRWWSPS